MSALHFRGTVDVDYFSARRLTAVFTYVDDVHVLSMEFRDLAKISASKYQQFVTGEVTQLLFGGTVELFRNDTHVTFTDYHSDCSSKLVFPLTACRAALQKMADFVMLNQEEMGDGEGPRNAARAKL